jgi:RNase H-like domain found in reverse transcriptase/Reverse transcriptase (RNA-dependent DNA polymerase)/Integrase zinc binding domain/Retroviral aspartyl protease
MDSFSIGSLEESKFNNIDECINLSLCSIRSMLQGHPRKKAKVEHMIPVVTGVIDTNKNGSSNTKVLVLLDSGASQSIVKYELIKQLNLIHSTPTTWNTVAGKFLTKHMVNIKFKLPTLHESRIIETKVHVTKSLNKYDMIIGRDLLQDLGIILNFQDNIIQWDHAITAMTSIDSEPIINTIEESKPIIEATNRIKSILEAKYEPANLDDVVNDCKNLSVSEKSQLKQLLNRYYDLFDGTLGHWKSEQYHIELKDDAKPYHARPYPIPKAYEATLKMEVERLCNIGVLKKINRSEWGSPTFIIPKKDKTVRFISDFRELNKRIKRKPFPLPKIQDLLLKLEGFQYASSLDLNMGYYHIELSPQSKKLCTIVLPWGKYEYQRLPMGLCNSPDIFQEKMNTLTGDLEYVRAYIDDLLILTKGTFTDHLVKLATVLSRLRKAGLKVNAKKSFFAREELEYLGYWITRHGIQPCSSKVLAIQQITEPKNKKELRKFIGMVNYYRDMWIRRSDILAPLASLTSKTTPWVWTNQHTIAFNNMKKIVSRETLLTYPNFSLPFDIYTDASHTQLGAVICQQNKPIAFYSRKLNPAQTRYTTTERELLAIVETLKEFRNILLGHQVRVYTDHKNLTYKNFNTERVMRWRLILEEFGPELNYVKGDTNIVADALSRLAITDQLDSASHSPNNLAEQFGLDMNDPSSIEYPLTYHNIRFHQQNDIPLRQMAASDSTYHLKSFRGGGTNVMLICHKNQIVIPKQLQQAIVTWYHNQLCHPGETRTEQTIRQHFWFNNLRQVVHDICSKCHTCQKCKMSYKKYGILPPKEAESEPWERLCVDLIGPYTIKQIGRKPLQLWCITMIDPATGWFEMKEIKNKEAITTANIVEQTWLTRYPIPQIMTFDRGTEFMAEFAEMIENDYGIKRKGTTVRNPQANAILERVHQTIGNMIRTFSKENLDEKDPWSGILAATMFAIRATYHTTMQATPAQLVFGRDSILNIKFDANWAFIRDQKQKIINKNNEKENASRIYYEYKPHEKVLYKNNLESKFNEDPWKGPFEIQKVNDNGTVCLKMGTITDVINIRNIKPYRE